MSRSIALALLSAALSWGSPGAGAAEVLLYRGDHVYLVPQEMASVMLGLDERQDWRHFAGLTRRIDGDGDGEADQLAIALGSRAGYGAQVRYRLRPRGVAGTGPSLGSWYWCVVTGPDGGRVFERFHP